MINLKKQESFIIRVLVITLGAFLSSISVIGFLVPHHLLSGGITGVALILKYCINLPVGFGFFILNLPIFIVGIRNVDRDFVLFSLLGMVELSVFLIIAAPLAPYIQIHDIMLSSITGGILNGIGCGLCFRSRASQGGTDVIATVLKRITGVEIASLSMLINIFIIAAGVIFIAAGLELVLYTLISIYVATICTQKVIDGFNHKKLLWIITNKEPEVAHAILTKLGRGVTLINAEGAYTGEQRKIIYSFITLTQIAKAKKIVQDIDSSAFITISNISEINGEGFKKAAL
ncbi:YitT family protein [Clostridium sp.]|uniref:YitT family protein n=1 Tax=Clostridium sp. TaxID=1506 RepID=UPI00260D7B14|nr:YitT family protein [uncultured Clostridium sp.]